MILTETYSIVATLGETPTTALTVIGDYMEQGETVAAVFVSSLSDTTATTILAAPATGVVYDIREVAIHNGDDVAHTLSVAFSDGTTSYGVVEVSIDVDETLLYLKNTGWCIQSGSSSGSTTTTVTLTGDVTGSGTGTVATTLSDTDVTAGSYTLASITVGSDGRLTAASSGSVDLSSYVTSDTLSTTLGDYVTSDTLTTTLASYSVTSDVFVLSSDNTITGDNEFQGSTSLTGGASIGGYSVSLGGAFTTGGAVTFSGAYAATFDVPGAYTYTLPAQSGTLAELELAQEFTATQTFSDEIVLTGKSTNLLRITPSDDTSETVAYGTNAANDTVRWEILNNGSIRTASGSNSNFGSSDETDYTLQVSGTFYVTDTATVGGGLTVTDTATVGMASTLSGTFTATADGTEVTEVISGLDSLGCYLVSVWASGANTDMTMIGLVNCGDANTIANVTTLIYNTYFKGSMSLGTYGGYTAFSYQAGEGLRFQIAATSTNSADVTVHWSLLKIGGF